MLQVSSKPHCTSGGDSPVVKDTHTILVLWALILGRLNRYDHELHD